MKGGFYTLECKICKTAYASSALILLITIVGPGQINIRETGLDIPLVIIFIVSGFVLSVAYLLPLSVFYRSDMKQE